VHTLLQMQMKHMMIQWEYHQLLTEHPLLIGKPLLFAQEMVS
jgi:hypothetical protein